jgi:hypothetical protein
MKNSKSLILQRSSVVEHSLGKGEVESSIPSGSNMVRRVIDDIATNVIHALPEAQRAGNLGHLALTIRFDRPI